MDRKEAIMRIVEHMHIHKIGEYPHIYIKEALVMAIAALQEEPVKHGRWVDRYGGKYANSLYECSECKGKALYKFEVDVLDREQIVQALTAICPHCGAKMDKEE